MIRTTRYYDEFIRYHGMAKRQQELCNLGLTPHRESGVNDSLMENVHLYDVVERKYAGFSQIINDAFYGLSDDHPYSFQMKAGKATPQRVSVATAWDRKNLKLEDWLYIFIVHRVTGSGINYAKKPSGYNNTIIPELSAGRDIEEFSDLIYEHQMRPKSDPIYTSVGYQFPAFPKPIEFYRRGGDYFLCEIAPGLAKDLARFLEGGKKPWLRDVGNFMLDWNVQHDLRRFRFQYSAVVADIADWFPDLVDRTTPFFYGSNAVECINYLADPVDGKRNEAFLDEVMLKAMEDTGNVPYNLEDVACDFIRWIENYVKPGGDYDGVDRDWVWNSSKVIHDHPYGRQEPMLRLGLIQSFNELDVHPSDDYVLKKAGWTVDQYRNKVREMEMSDAR